jgi:hypothetical protein
VLAEAEDGLVVAVASATIVVAGTDPLGRRAQGDAHH